MMKNVDEAAVTYRVVLTKADKLKASDLAKTVERVEAEQETRRRLPAGPCDERGKGMGIAELRAAVLADTGAERFRFGGGHASA